VLPGGPEGLALLPLGPLRLRPTGLLTALGIVVGLAVALRAARRDGLDGRTLLRSAALACGLGLVGAHLTHLLAYHPEELDDPWALLRLGDGLSSLGGIAGGALGGWLGLRRARPGLAAYGDALALGLAPGWAIGRLGCALVHDHPGPRLASPLSFAALDGPRLDLGALEAVALAGLAAVLLGLRRRGALRGRLLPLAALAYGLLRLGLDLLRATDLPGADARLAGLTPAQWLCLPLAAWGVVALRRGRPV
jgi:phosphatidylglycerol:prolipoprotein diacylglycerol transferase